MNDPESQWKGVQLRATVFHPPTSKIPGITQIWERITKAKPDRVIAEPKKGTIRQSGSLGDVDLLLSYSPERADWVVKPSEKEDESSPEEEKPHMIGPIRTLDLPFSELADKLLEITAIWVKDGNLGVTRLAFGADLLLPVPDIRTGYEVLSKFIQNCPESPESTDFLYQINRPRPSESYETLQINRLSKWSVVRLEDTRISVSLGDPPSGHVAKSSQFSCRLELDINTTPSNEVIPEEAINPLFGELQSLGLEIAGNGDIK